MKDLVNQAITISKQESIIQLNAAQMCESLEKIIMRKVVPYERRIIERKQLQIFKRGLSMSLSSIFEALNPSYANGLFAQKDFILK